MFTKFYWHEVRADSGFSRVISLVVNVSMEQDFLESLKAIK